ncbi:MAG TPA: HAD-IIIA family hydrolase [Bryobacteraceae bacterium]|jgi:D,D-heptose 1,7-bisphosphate phosphatase|nr:HAD-IIIA family hydrolase [Bryobacteraceae bacterium]
MQLVVVAGGRGTRLKDRLGDLPKPMVAIGGKPLLEHLILLAARHEIRDVLILTGYGGEFIEDYFGSGEPWGVRIRYRREDRPLGTAGAVLHAFDDLDSTFLLMYGDTMMNVDLNRFADSYPAEAAASLFVHPNDHPQDSDLVEIDSSGRILALHPYPHPPEQYFANLVNAAFYVIRKEALRSLIPKLAGLSHPLDFGKHVFPALLAQGAWLQAYVSREYIKDAGTPERLDQVEADFRSGRIARGSLSTPVPAIFLDRDGTLNDERGFLTSPEELALLPGTAAAVRAINASGRLAVLITNQPVIARGDCSAEELRRIHDKLEWLLGESHAFLDAIYHCPHHPDGGFPGERPELKFVCDCRKPAPGLLAQATADLNIDKSQSWMIGDRASDIHAARNFGIRSALVRTGQGRNVAPDCRPDLVSETLGEAVQAILTESIASR